MSYTRGPGVQHWHSISALSAGLIAPQAPPTTQAWPTNDLAIYTPVIVRSRVVVKQLWYANAATAVGNWDLGLYDASGAALVRKGSTAKASSGVEIVWDCTDTVLGPGIYYIALAASSNSDNYVMWSSTAPLLAAMGVLSEASALPLPVTATFSVPQTLTVSPLVGMFLDTRTT